MLLKLHVQDFSPSEQERCYFLKKALGRQGQNPACSPNLNWRDVDKLDPI